MLQYLWNNHPFDLPVDLSFDLTPPTLSTVVSLTSATSSSTESNEYTRQLSIPLSLTEQMRMTYVSTLILNDPLNIYIDSSYQCVINPDCEALTALTIACHHDHTDVVNWLIAHGAIITTRALTDAIKGIIKRYKSSSADIRWKKMNVAMLLSPLSVLSAQMTINDVWHDIRKRCKNENISIEVTNAIECYIWSTCLIPHRLAFIMAITKYSNGDMKSKLRYDLFDRNVIPIIFEFAALQPVISFN